MQSAPKVAIRVKVAILSQASEAMDRVLITGGAGFIGSHLVDAFLASGHEVLVVDDFSSGSYEHLSNAGSDAGLTLVEGDVRSLSDLSTVADFAPEIALHMAALHFIPYCEANPRDALAVNVLGLESVLRALRCAPLKAFLFASSGAVYGFGDSPWSESDEGRPDDVYSLSKWIGEHLVNRFHEDRPEVRTVVARLFNAYGPRETNPHVVADVLNALREGVTIHVGNLWPKRDLVQVSDAAAGILATLSGDPGFEVFNVGTGRATTIESVLDTISAILGGPLDVRQVPGRMRQREGHLVSNPRKLMSTGWEPAYDLESGLRHLLKHEGLL